MRLLELFSGTGSIGKAFPDFEVTSLDLVGSPTFKMDIMDWDYQSMPQDSYDVVWASPPCTHYSRCRTTAKTPRQLEASDALVQRALDIIEHFRPRVWLMENPATGMLKDRPVVAGLPFQDVCYCRYGAPYRKPPRVWGNLGDHWSPRPRCSRQCPGEQMSDGRHPISAQRKAGRPGDRVFTKEELCAIPPEVCEEMAAATRLALQVNP
jgi:hypothetical protein